MITPVVPPDFELSNLHRRYLGLCEADSAWERIPLKNSSWLLFFEGDVIRKIVSRSESHYFESDVCEHTAENRTILLPKTKRGKPKKLNYTALQSFSEKGIYFRFAYDYITLANYTTQTTFYQSRNTEGLNIDKWLRQWMEESTEKDIKEITAFKTAQRRHQKYAEGDYFAFKVGRHKWGFGRILLDLEKRAGTEKGFKENNLGFKGYMGKTLMVMVYRYLSDTPEVNLDDLGNYGTLPVQAIMDNHFYYGEYSIIGNRLVHPEEWEPLISLDKNNECQYLQYGLICAKTDTDFLKPYLVEGKCSASPIHDAGGSGFYLEHYDELEKIIKENIPNDSLMLSNENFKDLRKKENYPAKSAIFRILGLDPDKSYAENLQIWTAAQQETPSLTKYIND